MQLGAHEIMETHECLLEKINVITHFNLYAQQAKNPQLLDMIARHQQEEIRSYNEIVAITRGRNRFNPIPPNTPISGISNQQIQYGLNNPPQYAPQSDATLNDAEIAMALLSWHKNGARNCSWAALECADPNLRRALMNSAASCTNQAYEVFLFMNQQGLYQVPTLKSETAENFLNSYQPASASLGGQSAAQSGANAGYAGQSGYGASYSQLNAAGSVGNTAQTNIAGSVGNAMSGNFSAASRDSVLYGSGRGGSSYPYQAASPFAYSSMNGQGTMQ